MYITVANDFILVERKILYNDSLNCREKIALIILLDTDRCYNKKNQNYQSSRSN